MGVALYVLLVITHVNSGRVVAFQEFNSLNQCEYVASYLYKASDEVRTAVCFKK